MSNKTSSFVLILACSFFLISAVGCTSDSEKSLFTATGLLAHQGESAEEILMRAHHLELDAIALVVAGYSQGLEGFPKMPDIAQAWVDVSAKIGLPQDVAFLATMNDREVKDQRHSAALLADCDLAQGSRFIVAFAQAGIFDLAARRQELSAFQNQDWNWRQAYQRRQENLRQQTEYFRSLRVFVEELSMRPAKDDELERLSEYLHTDFSVLLYFAGREDEQNGKASWSTARCLNFIGQRFQDPDAGRSSVATNIPMWRILADSVNEQPNSPALDVIRNAHAGDMKARRTLAQNYLSYSDFGPFAIDTGLATAWLADNSDAGDVKSRLQTALYLYQGGDIAVAWALVEHSLKSMTGKDREVATTLLRVLKDDPRFDSEQAARFKAEHFDPLDE